MKNQRGIAEIFVILIIAAVATAGIGMALHTYKTAIERAELAEAQSRIDRQTASDQRAENARMKGAQEATDKIAAERKGSDIKKADIERMVTNALKGVYAKSPEARKWADTPVPGDVLASLRDAPGGAAGGNQNGARPAAVGAGAGNAGTGAAGGNDQRRAVGFRAPDSLKAK